MEQKSKKDLIVTLSILLVVVLIVTGVLIANKKKPTTSDSTEAPTTSETTPTPTDTTATTTDTDTTTNSSGFKDGTYSATGDYSTPEGTENIKVNVTLKDGVVTDTSAVASMKSRDSKEYAGQFVANYKPLVVGKNIASIKLSRVSGSSLTSQGFNDAIDQIETQAKA
jgi:uncharacterized protein with FMN-binding domain